ncbi:MAG: alpha/beta fold hydrolase [Sphingobacteriia bacterium]|nr:alpha/beta fold hydrolase [Sphingobacteriia bacterium]
MSVIILIHGAWHGAWCWKYIKPLLEEKGHIVITPDLPGLGEDKTSSSSVTMQMYINFISEIVNSQHEKVILVGHSLAGVIISGVAEAIPDKIKKLIYLCAFYVQNNESIQDVVNNKYICKNILEFDFYENGKLLSVKDHLLIPSFYNKCNIEDIDFSKQSLRPQSSEPFAARIKLSKEKYGSIPKIYIECIFDGGLPIEVQRKMVKEQPCKVYSLETDHSPFFSTPKKLVQILDKEAK